MPNIPPPTKVDLILEFLTPAVLGGARPRRCDPYLPLRPASLRGLWRYWFRAIAASLMWPEPGDDGGTRMLDQLRKAETRLFGDTDQRSRLIVLPPELPPPGSLPIPGQESGLRYLGYGLFEDRDRRPPECIMASTHARVSCRLRLPRADGTDARAVCATLWIWAALGGLGARARRGFGSVRLVALEGPPELVKPWNDLSALAPDHNTHLAQLSDGLGKAQDALLAFLRAEKIGDRQLQSNGPGPHPAIRSLDGIADVQTLRHSFRTGTEALDYAGQLFRGFRSTLARRAHGQPPLPDYFEVKSSLSAPFNPPSHVDRAAFGLPLRFYYRSLSGASTHFTPHVEGRRDPDRLASPLLFRVYELAPEGARRFGVAFINLAGKSTALALQGCKIAQARGKKPIPPPSSRIIHDFITWAINQPPPRSR